MMGWTWTVFNRKVTELASPYCVHSSLFLPYLFLFHFLELFLCSYHDIFLIVLQHTFTKKKELREIPKLDLFSLIALTSKSKVCNTRSTHKRVKNVRLKINHMDVVKRRGRYVWTPVHPIGVTPPYRYRNESHIPPATIDRKIESFIC